MHKLLKKACALAVAAVLLLSMPIAAQANQYDSENVAVRSFFEAENVRVEWYGPLQQASLTYGNNVVTFVIGGQTFATNNGVITVPFQYPVTLDDGITEMHLTDALAVLYWLTLDTSYVPLEGPAEEPVEAPAEEPAAPVSPTVTDPATYAHGQIAYGYLCFIEEYLYNRIGFTQRERDTAEWIAQELMNMGHDPANVSIQQFPVTDWVMDTIPILKVLSAAGDYFDEIPVEFQALLASLNIYTMDDILAHTFLAYSQNVVLTVPGVSERRIIVGAHYDSPNSPGISDNASGTVTLLESAHRILYLEHYYTITYIFFGAEEVGLVGAFYYAEALSDEDVADIVLMINIDVIFDGFDLTFGAGYFCMEAGTEAANQVTQVLLDIAEALNEEYDFGLVHEAYGIGLSSDQLAFLPLGVQVLTFYSMNNWTPSRANLDMLVAMFSGEPQDPLLNATRLELMLAVLDDTDDEETLAAIEEDRDMIEFLMDAIGVNSVDDVNYVIEMLLEMLEDNDDEDFIAVVNAELEVLELVVQILEHPEFVSADPAEGNYGIGMGLVLHTLNDNLTYINENFPGLIQTALEVYSLFLERVLTLPAGSLE